MKNVILSFVFGFLSHFVISGYLSSTKSVNLLYQDLSKPKNSDLKPIVEEDLNHDQALVKTSVSDEVKTKVAGFSDCPTEFQVREQNNSAFKKNESSVKNKKLFLELQKQVADRRLFDIDPNDIKLMEDKALSDPALVLARSEQVYSYDKLKMLNGIYKGQLNVFDPKSNSFVSSEGSIEIELTKDKDKNGNATGRYLIDLNKFGASSGTGSPNGFKNNSSTSDFFIHFNTDQYFQIVELSENLKANYYRGNELIGFAKFKKIR